MSDPWLTQAVRSESSESKSQDKSFEDNFASSENENKEEQNPRKELDCSGQETVRNNSNDHRPLPDSATYLQGLERKLEKIKKGSKLVEALAEKRQHCLRTLLSEDIDGIQNNNSFLTLDTPVDHVDSAVQGLYRHLQPVQPITIGETVHIVNYDQLEEQREAAETVEEDSDIPDK